jgi:acyl-CoA thioesterase-2
MGKALDQLVELLRLERLEQRLFRGQSQDLGWGTLFGGHVLGQALSAAAQTVPAGRNVHSLHGYFLRPGHVLHPIVYEVDPIRDGKSFTTRRVVAVQQGQAIFSMGASFQLPEEGYEHQAAMPEVTAPEDLPTEVELARKHLDRIPPPLRERVTAERAIEIRPVEPLSLVEPHLRPPHRSFWYRANGALADEPALHQYLLAYASDFYILRTAMEPHGVGPFSPGMQVASLDHAMWFHRPFRMDEWLLYVVESPSASGARGLVRGQLYRRDGVLVASVAQEGLMRDRSTQQAQPL